MADKPVTNAITLSLYKKNELLREVRQSILPWGILELAIELQEEFNGIEYDDEGKVVADSMNKEQMTKLTDFVIYIFDDDLTADELKRYASVEDVFAVYTQIFAMVGNIMKANPTIGQALNRQTNEKTKPKKPAQK
jgi:hypothetical protein